MVCTGTTGFLTKLDCLRGGGGICGVCNTPRKLNLDMPTGEVSSTPAKSKMSAQGQPLRLQNGLQPLVLCLLHISGTEEADDHGLDLALTPPN